MCRFDCFKSDRARLFINFYATFVLRYRCMFFSLYDNVTWRRNISVFRLVKNINLCFEIFYQVMLLSTTRKQKQARWTANFLQTDKNDAVSVNKWNRLSGKNVPENVISCYCFWPNVVNLRGLIIWHFVIMICVRVTRLLSFTSSEHNAPCKIN